MLLIYTIIFAVVAFLFIKNVAYPYAIDRYFKSEEFLALKESISQHVQDCNDLNQHIQNLKLSYADIESFDYGKGKLSDTSRYNMKRKNWSESTNNRWTHPCSLSIVKNANDQPFKYLCKYFNIKPTEETLEKFENALNDFSAAEQGKGLLVQERDETIASVMESIPPFVLRSSEERIKQELGFMLVSLSQLYFPVYTFQYVSAGGNSSSRFDFRLDLDQLERFIGYLAELVKFENSVAGQRALMTAKLRERIKVRDDFTCQICSLSTADEKNLLLEIDHIVPLSKGGKSTEDNLQVLCWRCNRSKGARTDHTPSLTHDQVVNKIPKPEVAARSATPPKLPQSTPVSIAESFKEKPRSATPKPSIDMTRPSVSTPPPFPQSHSVKATPESTTTADSTVPQPSSTNDVFLTCFPDPAAVKPAQATPSKPTSLTNAQKNAVRSAQSYLESSGFSRNGLIEQLKYDSYTVSDATTAVDSLDMNWTKQANKTAKSYLQDSGFSRKGLIEQLEYDGYTISDATTAVDGLDMSWIKQAKKTANSYLRDSGFSRNGLIEQLEYDGYSVNDATAAVDSLNLGQAKSDKPKQGNTETVEIIRKNPSDLTGPQKNAARSAKEWLDCSPYSRKGLIETLSESDGYGVSDATFAVDSLDMNWTKQAKKAAKEWIEFSPYSRKGLIETLTESDGYAVDDSTVAVDGLNIDWNEQALRSAKDWLEYSGYSRKSLIETLSESDGYSQSQATYAAEKAGA